MIEAEKATYKIAWMYRLLNVPRSSFPDHSRRTSNSQPSYSLGETRTPERVGDPGRPDLQERPNGHRDHGSHVEDPVS